MNLKEIRFKVEKKNKISDLPKKEKKEKILNFKQIPLAKRQVMISRKKK